MCIDVQLVVLDCVMAVADDVLARARVVVKPLLARRGEAGPARLTPRAATISEKM
jgi:hypothetical protein